MKASAENVIQDYLNFSGERTPEDFKRILKKVAQAMLASIGDEEAFIKLSFVLEKLEHGLAVSSQYGKIYAMVDDTEHDLEEHYQKYLKSNHKKPNARNDKKDLGKLKPRKTKTDLGKLVDEGDVPYRGRADQFWRGKMKVIFTPNNKQIRSGSEIPKSYEYDNLDFVENYYGLRAIEFGNWLSQQDRKNYVSGLGLALFDLHQVLGFNPKTISLRKKVSIAFGARGRGNALAHFEPDTFAINITRYSRPKKGASMKRGFDRTDLLTASGGVGSLAHEYGHALDYYGGMFLEKTDSGALSGGRSEREKPNLTLLKKNNLEGLMEKLLNKIIWQTDKKHTAYYERLKKAKLSDYYFRRNELFARAFESYVHFKMQKKKYKNIFLAETKYDPKVYLTTAEMKKLELDFDKLVNAMKKAL
jgi:hypothetical protein